MVQLTGICIKNTFVLPTSLPTTTPQKTFGWDSEDTVKTCNISEGERNDYFCDGGCGQFFRQQCLFLADKIEKKEEVYLFKDKNKITRAETQHDSPLGLDFAFCVLRWKTTIQLGH